METFGTTIIKALNIETNKYDKKKKRKKNRNWLINIQGLTQIKTSELEELTNETGIFCVTETPQKSQRVRFKDSTGCIYSMRDNGDKKGGGIMLIHQKAENVNIEKEATSHMDILNAKCTICGLTFRVIVVYLDTQKIERNMIIKRNIEQIIERNQDMHANNSATGLQWTYWVYRGTKIR